MAAQGNPQLYARQKAKYLTLSLLALLLLSVYVQAEVVLYCKVELATGFSKDKQTGQWRTSSFNLERYTIKFNDDYTSAAGLPGWFGETVPCVAGGLDEQTGQYNQGLDSQRMCSENSGFALQYDLRTRRFVYSELSLLGYLLNNHTSDNSSLHAGTCQKF
jgi:hypothetical protein